MPASPDNQAVGRRLQRLREERGWSMNELAARCSGARVTASQVNKLEKGWQQFTVDWLFRFARALRVPVRELVEDRPIGVGAEEPPVFDLIRELEEGDLELVERFVGRISQIPQKDAGDC